MAVKTYLETKHQLPITNTPLIENLILEMTHEYLSCPECSKFYPTFTTWGFYKKIGGLVRRYYCYDCKKACNPSKIPWVYDRMGKIALEIGKLVIKNNLSIRKVSMALDIPESTLQTAIVEIEQILSDNYEFIKTLDSALKEKISTNKKNFRVLYYDEGFHRLLGNNYYLVFAVNELGEPIQVNLVPSRDTETIRECLEQAIIKMGGVDLIVSDGAPAILSAIRSLKMSLVLIQQIHSDSGKRARIIKIDPILGTKRLRELTVELHTESLKSDKESIIRVKTKEVYPPKSKKKLQYQLSNFISKEEKKKLNSQEEHINTPRSNAKKKIKEKKEIQDVNWIWTPFTNL